MDRPRVIVLDTHVFVWQVSGETGRLTRKVRQLLRQHGKRKELVISSMTIFEIATLERRGRLRFSMPAHEWFERVRQLPEIRIEPVTDDVAERAAQFGDAFPGDSADRIIAATALLAGAPLITRDEKLHRIEYLQTIW